jgi:hypothetical protein
LQLSGHDSTGIVIADAAETHCAQLLAKQISACYNSAISTENN